MFSFFQNNKYFLLALSWIFLLLFLSDICFADLNDLVKDEEKKAIDISKTLTLPEDLNYPLFLGLCCGKCGGNMPLNIPGGGTPEPHELRIKTSLSWMKMIGLRRGTSNRSTSDTLVQYMMAPRSMDMQMSNLSIGHAFSDRFFAGIMGRIVVWYQRQ